MPSSRSWICMAALTLLASSPAHAAAVQTVTKLPAEVELKLDTGLLELRPISDSAIRVRFSDGQTVETPSFVLTAHHPAPKFEVTEDEKSIRVAVQKIQAVVDRQSGTISFRDATGKIFLTEKPGTRSLTPTSVLGVQSFVANQGFESPPDEKLYGMGQYQDGLWDWRGIPLELRQLNTQIAIPMLISNKGYGLLWDNASRTDFNLPGKQIQISTPEKADNAEAEGPTATEQLKVDKGKKKTLISNGSFTTGEAGDYVFCTRDGDRRDEIAILIDGRQIAGVKNIWTPSAVVGKISLPANKTVAVTVRGGGKDVKLFARPLGETTTFRSDYGQDIDYTVFYGPELDGVISSYRNATGQAPMWPKWAYGFWQCRERYSSQQQILDTAAEFRGRRIPVDLIVQDWQYWGKYGWGAYQWDEAHYPEPARLMQGLRDLNMKFMISVWCNPEGKAKEELKQNNLLAGQWIDIFDQKSRDIRWKYINDAFFSVGADGWWGDATEPGDPGTDLLGVKLSGGPGDFITSAYPLFASQALYEGQRATGSNKRVCTLTRSAFPGQQRYAAAGWSGDINGDWVTYKRQIPAGLNYCLTGQPYWTTDIGGFFHPKDQYASADFNELLTRWFQWSTFGPILRIHGYKTETEIWKWLPETQKNLIAYDRLRYRMLPYNYSVAWQVTSAGSTIMRALGMDFPDDPQAWDVAHQYMFGPAFLVSPVTEAKATTKEVYLPAGTSWVNFWTGEKQNGGRRVVTDAPIGILPLFVRAGSIIPFGPDLQYTSEKPADPIELRIYPGASGTFTLYEDEGDGYRYEKGAYATIPMTWDDRTNTLTLGKRQGDFPGMLKERTFRMVRVAPGTGTGIEAESKVQEIRYTGEPLMLSL